MDRQLFSLPRGPRPRKLGSPSATARFARAAAPQWQRRLKSNSSVNQTLLLETGTRHGSHFLRESFAGRKYHRPANQKRNTHVERNPCDAGATTWRTTGGQVKTEENEPHRGQLALSDADGFWPPTPCGRGSDHPSCSKDVPNPMTVKRWSKSCRLHELTLFSVTYAN